MYTALIFENRDLDLAASSYERKLMMEEILLTMRFTFFCLSFSFLISASMLSLMASLQALWQISVKSAPENPLVILARKGRSTSLEMGLFLRLDFRMAILEPSSGSGM